MAEGPDRGRAWVVAVAIMIMYITCSGAFRSQGLFFVSIISTFNVDRKMAALPFSVKGSVRNLLAPLVGVLGQKYGCSAVILIGGIISSASTALCYFAPDVLWLTGLWGGVSAIGAAMATVLPPVVIGQYFVKYRTTATGLAFSGSCIGAFVFPVIVEYLLLHYGLHGTFLIYAGVFLHIIPAAMLFTKPKWSTSIGNAQPEESSSEHEAKPDQSSKNGPAAAVNQNTLDAHPKVTFHVGDEPEPRQYLPSSKAMNSIFALHDQTTCQDSKNSLLKVPTISSLSLNSRLIKSSTDNFFDIDIDYLKQRDELLFNMLSMDLPNMEMSYRAILLEVDKDDLWHPEKEEIIQEVESIYIQLEKSLDIDIVSESTVRANGLYLKRTAINKALAASKKSQSLRGVRRYFKTYKARALHLGKNRSAPNISNIYNELVRRDYILSKLKMLCNSNEIRIISHLSEHNPRDVLKVLFQLRCLYALYQYLELNEHETANELGDSSNDGTDVFSHEQNPDQPVELSKTVVLDKTPRNDNSFLHHLKNAMRLFKNPHFLLICFTRTAHFVAFNPINTTIVDLTMDRGLRATDGKLAILALSAGDLIGRLGFGWVTDRGFATLPRFVLSGQILQCLCCVSISVLQAKWSLFPSIALFGMVTGSLYIRHSVLVSMYLRDEEQSIAMGCMELCSGLIGFLIPLYIGYFRDVIGSYNQMYYINGALALLAGLSWLLEPYFTKLNNFK